MTPRARTRSIAAIATVAALLATVFTAGPTSAAPSGAKTFDLFAGQTTDVGDVFVWNDSTHYYLEIDMASGWCMTERHVIAAASLADIPQANGNPIPGQFPLKESYKPCADADTLTIPIGTLGADPFFAVHVKAWEKDLSTVSIVSNAGSSNPVAVATSYPAFGSPVPAVVSSFAGWPPISGASYISNQATGDPFDTNMWRRVAETLTVPGWPVDGDLWVNSDNYELTKLNGAVIERDDDGPVATVENTAAEPAGANPQTWTTIKHVTFTPKTTNAFQFIYRNSTWGGASGFTDNPTGLIYKAQATYYAHSESAWAGTLDFPGRNWATYFQYGFQPVLLQTVTVPATNPAGVTTMSLPNEKALQFKVTGTTTWLNRNGFDVVDAECVNTNGAGWVQGVSGYPDDLLNLQVDAVSVDWIPVTPANLAGCSNSHEYTFDTTGAGIAKTLRIYDGTGNVQDPRWFTDNSGSLTVQIYQTAP
jgi:hypothetical protein